jgi:hypothetical protein
VNRYLPLLALVACGEFRFEVPGSDDTSSLAESDALNPIRLDVYAASATDLGLLNQSFFVDADRTENMNLQVKPAVEVEGSLSGFQTNPTADVQVPGALGAVNGQLRAFVPNSLMSYAVSTDKTGAFSFQAVPSENYTLAWIPDTDVLLPFEIEEGVPILLNTALHKVLSYEQSRPIYGRVKDDTGLGIPGMNVQAIDPFTGIGNNSLQTNNMGAFHTRLYPGEYILKISGDADSALPTLQITLLVSEDASGDIHSEVQLGNLDTINADGRVLNADGSAAANVLVRFTATSVDGHPKAEFTTQSTTGSNGRYSIPVLPGTYEVEFIPNHEGDFSPVSLSDAIRLNDSVTELSTVELPDRPVVNGRLVDAFGEAAVGALVRAQEQGFDGAVFETFTGDMGLYSLAVSEGPLFWTFVPADPSQGAISFKDASFAAMDTEEFQLHEGQLVSGCITHEEGSVGFAPVEVRNDDGLLYASTFTDSKGCFEVRVDLMRDSAN